MIAAVAVLSLVAVVLVIARDDDARWSVGGTGGVAETTETIGPAGGRMVIPASDGAGAGIALKVPAGALGGEMELTVSASPGRVGGLVDLAGEEPGVWSALADYALDDEDTLVHPVFGPLVLASLSEMTGPVIAFGPSTP